MAEILVSDWCEGTRTPATAAGRLHFGCPKGEADPMLAGAMGKSEKADSL